MWKYKRWIALLFLAIVAGAFLAFPRLLRAFAYAEQVSKPSIAKKLAIRPTIEKPRVPDATRTIDTLYSTFEVPAREFNKMASHQTWLILSGADDTEILLTGIGNSSEHGPTGMLNFHEQALHTYPLSPWEVFVMSDSDFTAHMELALGKAATPCADRDVSFFETSTAKGIIRYGSTMSFPDIINLAIWDSTQSIFQEITITASDAELRKQTAHSVAATYRFTVDNAPDDKALFQFVEKAVEQFQGIEN